MKVVGGANPCPGGGKSAGGGKSPGVGKSSGGGKMFDDCGLALTELFKVAISIPCPLAQSTKLFGRYSRSLRQRSKTDTSIVSLTMACVPSLCSFGGSPIGRK